MDRDARHQGIDIDPVPAGPVGYRITDRSLAIQNREGVFVTQATQVDRGVTDPPGSCHAAGIGLGDAVVAIVLGHVVEEECGQIGRREVHQILTVEDSHRRRRVDPGVKVRTRHHDFLQLRALFLRERWRAKNCCKCTDHGAVKEFS